MVVLGSTTHGVSSCQAAATAVSQLNPYTALDGTYDLFGFKNTWDLLFRSVVSIRDVVGKLV